MTTLYPRCEAVLRIVFDQFDAEQEGSRARPLVATVSPLRATVRLNDYYQADEWEIEVDAKDMPVSPDLIRNMAAEIYMYSAASVHEPFNVQDHLQHRLIGGICDTMRLRLDDEGRIFAASGTDYTAILHGKKWPVTAVPGKTGKASKKVGQKPNTGGKKLATWVREAVAEVVNVAGVLEVVWESEEGEPTLDKHAIRAVKDGRTYWDVIYQVVLESGFICFIRGDELVITTPQDQVVIDEKKAGGLRLLQYGHTLEYLEFERTVGADQVPQQVVKGYDPKTRKAIEVRYPEKQETVTTGIGTDKDTQEVSVLHGVTDPAALRRYAIAKYNAQARGELQIKWGTPDMKDVDGASLLEVRAGTPVYIGFDAFGDDEMRKLPAGLRVLRMVEMGFSPEIAQIVGQNYDALAQLSRPYYTAVATHTFSVDEGYKLEAESLNYVAPDRRAA